MTDFSTLKTKILNEALDQPLLTAIFICDFGILLFHRPPILYSLVMMGLLVAIAMYFGQKLALFNIRTAFQFLKTFNFSKSTEKAMADVEKTVSNAVADVEKVVAKGVAEAKEAVSDVQSAVASAVEAKPAAKPKTAAKPKAKPKA